MNIKFPYLFFLLLLFTACNGNQSSPNSQTKSNEEDSITKKEKQLLKELDEKTGVRTQTIWHSPRLVIQQLGELKGKTVANIGAGPYGYFSFQIASKAKKVIAIDIDPTAIRFIDSMRLQLLPPALQDHLETRLVKPDNPKLNLGEADIVTIMNTYAYLPDRINYLKNLRKGMTPKGKLLIVDFKMRQLPIGPPQSEKVPLYQIELDLEAAGFKIELVDDKSLDYQYIVMAKKK